VIQRFSPAFSGGDGNAQIVLDFTLPDKVIQPPWAEAAVKGYVLSAGFARYYALYFTFTPYSLPALNEK
jgi:hypothetical protein